MRTNNRLALFLLLAACGCTNTTVVYIDSGGGNPDLAMEQCNPGNEDLAMPGGPPGPDMSCRGPSKLFPPKTGTTMTLYCPFAPKGMDYCDPSTQHCCEPAMGTSACTANGTACGAGAVDWGCEDPVADCKDAANPVCCAPGASIGLDPCTGNFAHKMTSTSCVASGSCTGIVMCTSDSECPSGQHCTPFRKAGNQVGGCM